MEQRADYSAAELWEQLHGGAGDAQSWLHASMHWRPCLTFVIQNERHNPETESDPHFKQLCGPCSWLLLWSGLYGHWQTHGTA